MSSSLSWCALTNVPLAPIVLGQLKKVFHSPFTKMPSFQDLQYGISCKDPSDTAAGEL